MVRIFHDKRKDAWLILNSPEIRTVVSTGIQRKDPGVWKRDSSRLPRDDRCSKKLVLLKRLLEEGQQVLPTNLSAKQEND